MLLVANKTLSNFYCNVVEWRNLIRLFSQYVETSPLHCASVEVTWAFTATLKYTITLQSKVIAKLTVGFRPYRPNENARLRYILSVLI